MLFEKSIRQGEDHKSVHVPVWVYRLFLQQIAAAEQRKIAQLVERCNASKSQRRGWQDGGTFRTIAETKFRQN